MRFGTKENRCTARKINGKEVRRQVWDKCVSTDKVVEGNSLFCPNSFAPNAITFWLKITNIVFDQLIILEVNKDKPWRHSIYNLHKVDHPDLDGPFFGRNIYFDSNWLFGSFNKLCLRPARRATKLYIQIMKSQTTNYSNCLLKMFCRWKLFR